MSDQFLVEFCARVEAALTESETQSKASDQEIGSHLARLTRRMELLAETVHNRKQADDALRKRVTEDLVALRGAFPDGMAGASDKQGQLEQLERRLAEQAEASEAARRRVDELVRDLEQRDTDLGQARDRLQELESELSQLRAENDALGTEQTLAADSDQALAEAEAALEQANAEIEALRSSAEKVGAAERLLEAERQRADELELQLKTETANGTKAIIAQQLAEALGDAESARAELATLRSELESVRRQAEEKAIEMDRITTPKRPKVDRQVQKRQLGEMLLEAGVITQEQLDSAIGEQFAEPDRSITDILVAQGAVAEEVAAQAVAAQHRVLYVHLNEESVDPAAAALITPKIATQHRCVPVRVTDDALVLAMVDPLNVIAIEDVERASNRSVRPVMATQSAIKAAIGRLYPEPEEQLQ